MITNKSYQLDVNMGSGFAGNSFGMAYLLS